MRAEHEVVVLDHEVVDGNDRQVAAKSLPAAAVVERDVRAGLGAGVQQPLLGGILADHAREVVAGDAAGDLRPGSPVVLRFEEVRPEVVLLVAVRRDIRGPGVVRRGLDDRHERPAADPLRRHVLPRLPVVTRDVHEAVVRARPQHAARDRRLREGEDRAVVLGAGVVLRDRAARGAEPLRIVSREVGADGLPRLALVARAEDAVAAVVEHVRVVWRQRDRRRPLEPVAHGARALPRARLGPHADEPRLFRAAIVPRDDPLVLAGVDDVGVVRPHRDVSGLAAADREVIRGGHAGDRRAARDAHRSVVLLAAVYPVRRAHVRGDVVELGRRLVVHAAPALTAVERHHASAVVALDHAVRVVGIDPEVVVVAVRDRHLHERLAAVIRSPRIDIEDPRGLGILRIRVDVVVIPGALTQVAVFGAALPVVATVVGAERRAVLGLDDHEHAPALRRRCGDADLAQQTLRKTARAADIGPGFAGVVRAEDAAARPTRDELVGTAHGLPDRRVEDARIVRVHRDVDGPGTLVAIEHALPRLAAVARAEHAALGVRSMRVPERRDVDGVGILGMDAELADVARALEPEVRPRLARIGRAVHAVAV